MPYAGGSMYGLPQQPTQSVYGGSQLGFGGYTDGQAVQPAQASMSGSPEAGLPAESQIRTDIRSLIAESDLTTVTKKQLRAKLEAKYGVPLEAKKAFVNGEIEKVLAES
jgi:chitin synthase